MWGGDTGGFSKAVFFRPLGHWHTHTSPALSLTCTYYEREALKCGNQM